MSSKRRTSWVIRAVLAGLVGSIMGAGLGTAVYLAIPGAMRLDWTVMFPVIFSYAGLCGVLGGLGIGAGMVFAVRGQPDRVSARRLVAGSVAGALVGGILPAVVGIAGFASLRAPFMGTENIVGCTWLGVSLFAAVWSPAIDGRRERSLLLRFGASTLASAIVAAALAGLVGGLALIFDLVPDYAFLDHLAGDIGLVPLGIVAGSALLVAVGVFMGLACWMHITLMLGYERLRS
jgi:hypothetical protein